MKIKNVLMLLAVLSTASSVSGQNRWNISAGANVSHMCEKLYYGEHYGWGAGAFIAGGYEINFSEHWSLMPQVELSYVDNGAKLDVASLDKVQNNLSWRGSLSAAVPVTAAFRFRLSGTTGMRISAGPYLQEALLVRKYDDYGDRKVNDGVRFIDRLNFGVLGEAAVETGRHFAYTLSARYPFLKETWSRQTFTMSIGVRYSF